MDLEYYVLLAIFLHEQHHDNDLGVLMQPTTVADESDLWYFLCII